MTKKPTEWENVKVKKAIVNKMRSHKKKTGVSIMAFTEQSIVKNLQESKTNKS